MEIECYPYAPVPQYNYYKFWYADSDGSLSYNGYEFICQPMPYNMLIKQITWLHGRVGGWRVDHKCGLHIHVSRAIWSAKREQAFTAFLCSLNSTQMKELFGRESNQYTRPTVPSYDKYRSVNLLHPATYEFRLWAAGDLVWTLEALRRTKIVIQHRGKWSYNICLELFTKPEGLLKLKTEEVVQTTPAVRRVRRIPAVSV